MHKLFISLLSCHVKIFTESKNAYDQRGHIMVIFAFVANVYFLYIVDYASATVKTSQLIQNVQKMYVKPLLKRARWSFLDCSNFSLKEKFYVSI